MAPPPYCCWGIAVPLVALLSGRKFMGYREGQFTGQYPQKIEAPHPAPLFPRACYLLYFTFSFDRLAHLRGR